MIEVERGWVAPPTLTLPEKDILSPGLTLGRPGAVKATGHWIQFGRWGKIEHLLRLSHMTRLNSVQDVHPFLRRMDFIAV